MRAHSQVNGLKWAYSNIIVKCVPFFYGRADFDTSPHVDLTELAKDGKLDANSILLWVSLCVCFSIGKPFAELEV